MPTFTCPKCDHEIPRTNLELSNETDEYIDLDAYCAYCEDVVLFVRIKIEDWIETNI